MTVADYRPPYFPFTALVGQDALKLSLVVNAIHHGVMGVLIRGQKGTAKSTAARALTELLPPVKAVLGCRYGCDPDAPKRKLCAECRDKKAKGINFEVKSARAPFVTLPVNATEDSLVGSIDFEIAIKSGKKCFQPGVLANVHRGILYVDEVNLLDDHLVDLLLDVAASGLNIVEREGVSYVHPSEFILIGTMNPEEGDLRPQFLDRFGLCVQVESIEEPAKRVEVLKRRDEFESHPIQFIDKWRKSEQKERRRIEKAISLFDRVEIIDLQLDEIARICRDAGVAGHRADIVIEKAARAIAAYMGRDKVKEKDIRMAAFLALPHRARNVADDDLPQDKSQGCSEQEGEQSNETEEGSLEQTETDQGQHDQDAQSAESGSTELDQEAQAAKAEPAEGFDDNPDESGQPSAIFAEEVFEIGKLIPIGTRDIRHERDTMARSQSGRRQRTKSARKSGRYVRSTLPRGSDDLAFDATLRAAAPYQIRREKGPLAISIEPQDIREKVRERKTSTLLVFVVDASGSMGTKLMTETKGAIMYLLLEAYQKRDRVCMVAFKGDGSELLLPPTDSIELAKKKLEELPTGGKTPLCAGLLQGYEVIRNSVRQNPDILPLLVLITDGRANVGADPRRSYEGIFHTRLYDELYAVADVLNAEPRLKCLVIDAEEKRMGAFGKAGKLAERMGAKYLVLEEIRSGHIANAVRTELGR